MKRLWVIALVLVVWCIDWTRALSEPLISTIAVGIVVGPMLLGILQLWGQAKREIGDLKEETRFGEFDKHRLRMLQRDTLRRLDLPDERLPVYITADKSLNAGALRLGLGGFFKSLNGIYLNRQVLHKLTAEEVQDVMGHELGHYYRYYLLSDRFRGLTFALGAAGGLLTAQLVDLGGFIGLIVVSGCASLFWKLAHLPMARHGMTIEYLCDDLGAQVHGIHVSINGLLKIGAESEMQLAIEQEAILAGRSGALSAREIAEAVQSAIPYGYATADELRSAAERSIEQRSRRRRASLGDFLKYAWQGDAEAEVDTQLEQRARTIRKLRELQRLPWERLLRNPNRIDFQPDELPVLIAAMESNPNALLFHLPDAIGDGDGIHPPMRDRILYLWANRDAIAAARSSNRSRLGGTSQSDA